jgi:hypothetical protein
VIPRRRRDHTPSFFIGGQGAELVESAPEFEGTRFLLALPLEINLGAGQAAERGRAFERRTDDIGPDAGPGPVDFLAEAGGHGRLFHLPYFAILALFITVVIVIGEGRSRNRFLSGWQCNIIGKS